MPRRYSVAASRHHRVDIPWRRVAAPPRGPRGYSVERGRSTAAAATWIVRRDGPRRRCKSEPSSRRVRRSRSQVRARRGAARERTGVRGRPACGAALRAAFGVGGRGLSFLTASFGSKAGLHSAWVGEVSPPYKRETKTKLDTPSIPHVRPRTHAAPGKPRDATRGMAPLELADVLHGRVFQVQSRQSQRPERARDRACCGEPDVTVPSPRRRLAAPLRGATWIFRGGVAAPPRGATWIFRGDGSRPRRGVPRGYSAETCSPRRHMVATFGGRTD